MANKQKPTAANQLDNELASSVKRWDKFSGRCKTSSLNVSAFPKLVVTLFEQSPIPALAIASSFLKPTPGTIDDPRIPCYVDKLLELSLIDFADVLEILRKFSRFGHPTKEADPNSNDGKSTKLFNSPELEIIILLRARRSVSTGIIPKNNQEGAAILKSTAAWMLSLAKIFSSPDSVKRLQNASELARQEASDIFDYTGMLAVSICESEKFSGPVFRSASKDTQSRFSKALIAYVRSSESNPNHITARLEELRHQFEIPDDLLSKTISSGMEQAIASAARDVQQNSLLNAANVADLPIINSRAGLYIYINSILIGRPQTDDTSILSFLHNRYKENISMLAVDLITASFDVLSNAMFRNESNQMLLIPKSFLINKVPLLLANLSAVMFPSTNAELCISQALKFVDPRAFPSFFDMSNDGGLLSDVRQDFLFACCLHGLVPEANIEVLLGEPPMQTLPTGGRSIKEDLVVQFLAEPEKIETYIGELDEMSGNVGAIATAIGEVVAAMCLNKETMSLKSVCIALARKPVVLDILLLFNSASAFLRPLCLLLDGWKHDDDQGEHLPIYEEFGGILMLVFAFIQRYDLSANDLGLVNPDSFILQLMDNTTNFKQMSDLSSVQSKNLERWLVGLFKDGQISEELLSSCTPQQFYLLIPAFFYQTILACNTSKINNERLKGGLEYLLQPFLLPALIRAFSWLSGYIWQQHPDPDLKNTLNILSLLTKPANLSGEAATMHSSILLMVAKPIEAHLRVLQASKGRDRKDLEPLIQVLQPIPSFKRTTSGSKSETSAWTLVAGGIRSTLKQTVQVLTRWAANPDDGVASAPYTHRQIVFAWDMLGSQTVVSTLLDELKAQFDSQSGLADIAMDVVTMMICATRESAGQHGHMSLREAVRLAAEQPQKLAGGDSADTSRAELVIRLHRRVEMQLATTNLLPVPDVAAMVDGELNKEIKLEEQIAINVQSDDIENMMSIEMGDSDVFASMGEIGLGGGIMDLE